MFRWCEEQPQKAFAFGVHWAVTDRFGGRSRGTFGEFNLGAGVNDDPQVVQHNRSLLAAEFGVSASELRFMRQQHGVSVECVRGPAPPLGAEPSCDAMITDDPQVALVVLVADCTPVLLLDRSAGWVGVVHAGRAGMSGEVVLRCVAALTARGATDLQALVGPSICGRCYEVPEHLQESALGRWSAARAMSWTGTAALDVSAGVVQQLQQARVPVRWLPGCTRESGDLYSYRADPHTGRFAAVVRLVREPVQ